MLSVNKAKLSGIADGNPGLLITATDSAGAQTVHVAVSGTSDWDEVYLFAANNSADDIDLSLRLGGNTITTTLPGKGGPVCLLPGQALNNGAAIKAFAASASKVVVFGYVNRARN
jgi:hypothetical protein